MYCKHNYDKMIILTSMLAGWNPLTQTLFYCSASTALGLVNYLGNFEICSQVDEFCCGRRRQQIALGPSMSTWEGHPLHC